MKIIYCIEGIFNSGGMEKVLMIKANYLADILGYEVIIVTSQQRNRPTFFSFSEKIRFLDLAINYDKDRNRNLFFRHFMWKVKEIIHYRKMSRVLYKESPDICISMFGFEAEFLYKIKDGSKKILEYHFSKKASSLEAGNKCIHWLRKLRAKKWESLILKYDSFVVLTKEDKKAWGETKNIKSIPNPIVGLPSETSGLLTKRVISIGRLTYQKGFDLLIRAWKKVHEFYPDWQLCIIGDGEKKEELVDLICDLQLSTSVYLLPAMKEIGKEYLNCSIYAMSSRYEGMAMVLLEAQSYGLPIVSFRCPCGPQDLINESCGSLVPAGDIDQFAKELMYWMENEDKRKMAGVKARYNSSLYLLSTVMNLWINLFNGLLLKKG